MTDSKPLPILLATLGDTHIGLPAHVVREIVRAVAIEPLPGAPSIIEGVVNLRGRVIPVVDARQRLGMPPVALAPEQFLVAIEVGERLVAIRVDDVEEVTVIPDEALERPATISPVLQRLSGVASTAAGAVVIYDVASFLSQAEMDALDAASGMTR